MNLYFLDGDDKQHLIATEVSEEECTKLVHADLETRKPGFEVYYIRTWWDDFFRYWIDFGSHTEFYILQDANKAINLADEKIEHKCCGKDYCEL